MAGNAILSRLTALLIEATKAQRKLIQQQDSDHRLKSQVRTIRASLKTIGWNQKLES